MVNKHGHLTWQEVLDRLNALSEEHLRNTATVRGVVLDEFSPLTGFGVSKSGDPADGVLDDGHLYLEYDG